MGSGIKDKLSTALKTHCESCGMCRYAEKKPESFIGRIVRWHKTWCPAWKAYQRHLNNAPAEDVSPAP